MKYTICALAALSFLATTPAVALDCHTVTCAKGKHCVMEEGKPHCVAVPHGGDGHTCGGIAGLRCPDGYRCDITAKHPDATGKCVKKETGGGGGIHSHPSCLTITCGSGKHCEQGKDGKAGCVANSGSTSAPKCGGIAGLHCPSGYTCKMTANYPDAMGTCEKSSDTGTTGGRPEGATCGGIAALRCAAGLTCKLAGNFPDAGGTCVKAGDTGTTGGRPEGAMCGGIAAFRCAAGLTCKLAGNFPDAGGTCVKAGSTGGGGGTTSGRPEGAMCGGIAGFRCAEGLRCKLNGNYPDAAGTCTK